MSVSLNGVARSYTNIGSFLGRTYDPSLLQVLGVPDVDGKDLTTKTLHVHFRHFCHS